MITEETRKEVFERSKGRCECGCGKLILYMHEFPSRYGWEVHHNHWRSEYKWSDRDEKRNLSALQWECHKSIHNGNQSLNLKMKEQSDLAKPIEERSKIKYKPTIKVKIKSKPLPKIDKQVQKDMRKKQLDYFKRNHDGLSPSQYQYKIQKEFLKNKKSQCLEDESIKTQE